MVGSGTFGVLVGMKFIVAAVTFMFSLGMSNCWAEDVELRALFDASKIDGTLVLASLDGREYIHNDSRSKIRYTAASTFKIPNTLIGLQEGVLVDETSIFTWDKIDRAISTWNSDQTLQSAFRVSCVWCYQQLASKIGKDSYRKYLSSMQYGELAEPFLQTNFWLDGSLTISAVEQITFLKKVYRREFPFSKKAYDVLTTVMKESSNRSGTLYAKTGFTGAAQPSIGWYVGYVQKADQVWFFALNMRMRGEADLETRRTLVQQALKIKGIHAVADI